MQDQGKRLLLAVAAALGVLLLFQYFGPKDEKKPDPAAGSGSGAAGTAAKTTAENLRLDVGPCSPSAEQPARGPEQFLDVAYEGRFSAKFSSYGAELVSWKLADPRFGNDQTKGELLPDRTKFPEKGAFGLGFTCDSSYQLPLHGEWKGERVSDTVIRYTYPAKAAPGDVFSIEKTFTIDPDAFAVRMVAKIAMNLATGKEAYQSLVFTTFEYQDPKKAEEGATGQSMARAWHSAAFRGEEVVATPVTEMIKDRADGMLRHEKSVAWSGFEHAYLMVMFAPKPMVATEHFEKWSTSSVEGMMHDGIFFPRQTVKAGDAAMTREVYAYLGPKNYKDLERAEDRAGFTTHLTAPIDLGWFAFIGRPLMWLLLKFQSAVVNWGIAIMLLTILVKGATLYWTTKSMRSMKAMAALGPEMKALQARYKDDKQRLQAETMALYKTHKVNPIAGCLPILLQMPIWLALYRMLSSAGELYQQPFIPGWINDLTAPDPTHVLPAILVVTMFVQARLTPATGDSTQQKIMQYGMPLMFGVMSFFFPAGLTLYIFTNTLLSAVHSIYMNKYDKPSLAMAAKLKENQAKAEAEAAAAKAGGAKKPAASTTKSTIEAAKDSASDAVEKTDGVEGEPRVPRKKKKKKNR